MTDLAARSAEHVEDLRGGAQPGRADTGAGRACAREALAADGAEDGVGRGRDDHDDAAGRALFGAAVIRSRPFDPRKASSAGPGSPPHASRTPA